jgi:uracil-DNA glycosylase
LIRPEGADIWILQSYHPSRQNTQTGRLTESMFSDIWAETRRLIH